MGIRICPWRHAYLFDNCFRRFFHKPEKIFFPYLKEGMTAADIGCGMGFFSIAMAKMVGEGGKVISVDVQKEMLKVLRKRAEKAGVVSRIHTHNCKQNEIEINEEVDFVLTFWMVHEIPDKENFFKQINSSLKMQGILFIVEPKIHVSSEDFKETLNLAQRVGFKLCDTPKISLSRAAVLKKF